MKTYLPTLFLILNFSLAAQTEYDYKDSDLDVPGFLLDPNYIAENTNSDPNEDISVDIDETVVGEINGITVVQIRHSYSEHNSGTDEYYLATFDKSMKLVDFTYLHEYDESDWCWTTEHSTEHEEPNLIKYYHVLAHYRPAENTEEVAETGGMVFDRADTTSFCFLISKSGKMAECEAAEEQVEMDLLAIDEEASIKEIRKHVTNINNNAKSFRKQARKAGKNISLTYFYDGKDLKKIVANNPDKKLVTEFFFNKKQLLFVFGYQKETKQANRYYFKNDILFQWLKGKEKELIDPFTDEFKAKEKSILEETKRYFIGY